MTAFLRLSLFLLYFAEYAALIGAMELAKTLGGSGHVVSIFTVYYIPPLLLALIATAWTKRQKNPAWQLSLLTLGSAFLSLCLLSSFSFLALLILVVALGFTKSCSQVLVNAIIKRSFSPEVGQKFLRDIVSIRFFIMVFGGALGAYWGSEGKFVPLFALTALIYAVSGLVFLSLMPAIKRADRAEKLDESPRLFSENIIRTFGTMAFVWFLFTYIGLGSFMALEYPLITTYLGISPKLILIVWSGHAIGTILAWAIQNQVHRLMNLKTQVYALSALQIIALGFFGILGPNLVVVTFQMALLAGLMVLTEVAFGSYLLARSTQLSYPGVNLQFQVLYRFAGLVGSILCLGIQTQVSLLQTNFYLAALCLITPALGYFFIKLRAPQEVKL